ncbi:hypothetical protein IQ238_29130 [Pleurocapsales cyanobacterium LEGE 06147]|nr:hypothetical protein [Pleurocapsales cyanobacterium LEGE 06147]
MLINLETNREEVEKHRKRFLVLHHNGMSKADWETGRCGDTAGDAGNKSFGESPRLLMRARRIFCLHIRKSSRKYATPIFERQAA